MEYVKKRLTSLRFLSALPPEYDVQVDRLRTEITGGELSLKRINEVVGDHLDTLKRSSKFGRGGKALVAMKGNFGRGRGRGRGRFNDPDGGRS